MSDSEKHMRAVEIREPGGPEVLQPATVEIPSIEADEILVEVAAAGVNRPDCLQRAGLYPLPPDASPLPGLELAGTVVACGSEVQRWNTGDRVVALTHGGSYAQFCKVNQAHALPWPQGLSATAAAGLPETLFTVHHNLIDRGELKRGESVLIHGGSSGIGSSAIQVAKAFGATVLTTAGSAEKCEYCTSLGADVVINYREADFEEAVKQATAGAGVDVVLDMVGGDYVMKNVRLLREDGRYILIAFLNGPKAEINFASFLPRRLKLAGSTLRPQSVAAKAKIAQDVERDLWPLVSAGKIESRVFAEFPLEQAAAAHELMESSAHMGKIVLTVAEGQ